MVVLLAIIAALQYRWTAEVTGVNELQVGRELESVMIRWHLDLYREFSAVCVALQVGPDSGAHDSWQDYLERYVKWSSGEQTKTSFINLYRNPDLVENIYIWETSRRVPRLLRFNVKSETIDVSSLRPDLTTLLNRLQANSANLSMALDAWRSPDLASGQRSNADDISRTASLRGTVTTGWQFDETMPLIVHPIVRRDDNTPVDWIIVVLNRETIRVKILPELVRRHFAGPHGLDFKVAVLATGKSSRVIYSSEPGFGTQDFDAYDSVMNLFGPPPESVEGLLWQNVSNVEWLRNQQWRSFSSPVWFPTIEYGAPGNSWVLVVQGRNGPLQAVVKTAQRRNLAISALVLVLLAMNMGVAMVAGLRAQKFADLQMNFVASVSHELRTPLSVLYAAAENIKDGLIEGKANLLDYGSLMLSQARQLMYHVDRIMLFASIRSGKARYTLRPLQVSEIIQRVVIATEEFLSESGCALVRNTQPDLPCISGDLYAICSCLENLVTNAIKYSDKDRHICISAVHHRTESGPGEVWVSVEDTGIGISRSELSNIFEPFYRSPMATAAQVHGTGLGLFVAKHIAEAMGGRLSVTSQVGVGSVFTLQLRVWEPSQDAFSTVGSSIHGEILDEREHSTDRG
jgi:signal transduction histidine kinase